MVQKKFPATMQGHGQVLDLIEDTLLKYNMNRKDVNHAILSVDETIGSIIQNAKPDTEIECKIRYWFGKITIKIVSQGEKIDLSATLLENQAIDPSMDHDAEEAIRGMLLKRLLQDIKYKHVNGYNTLIVNAGHEEKTFILHTLGALFIAVLFGLLGRQVLGETAITNVDTFFLEPVRKMFLSAIGLLAAPCVFLGIALSVANFKNYFEFGKIGLNVVVSYCITTIFAVFVGLFSFLILRPGTFGIISKEVAQNVQKVSYLDMIVKIVPSNVIEPFVSDSTLQLIFFGILCGAALSMIGDYTAILKQIFEAFDALISALRNIIINVFPLAIFCTTTHLFITAGNGVLTSLLHMIVTEIFATVVMVIVYCIIILVVGKLNPLVFLKKYAPNFLPTLAAASYGVTMPDIMNTCKNKLGISNKVCSFSLPLGALINLDGSCIYFSIAALFLARICGIELTMTQIVVMLISIVILSFGAPGQAGSGVMCLTAILVQIGVPMASLTFIVSIDAFIGLFRKMSNICGDVVCSLTVASSAGLVNKDIYYSK